MISPRRSSPSSSTLEDISPRGALAFVGYERGRLTSPPTVPQDPPERKRGTLLTLAKRAAISSLHRSPAHVQLVGDRVLLGPRAPCPLGCAPRADLVLARHANAARLGGLPAAWHNAARGAVPYPSIRLFIRLLGVEIRED